MHNSESIDQILREHSENDARLAERKHTGKLYGELLGHPVRRVRISEGDWRALGGIAFVLGCWEYRLRVNG